MTLNGTPSAPIVDRSFSLGAADASTVVVISGTFRSFTSLGGTWLVFGTSCNVFSLGSWSATKVGDDTISIFIDDAQFVEGDGVGIPGTLEVTLDKATSEQVTVDFSTRSGTASGGSDFVTDFGTVTFAPSETSKMVTIEMIGDTQAEFPESFFVDLSGGVNARVFDSSGFGLIVDHDLAEQPPAMAYVGSLFDADADIDGLNSAESVAMSPDGAHVYVASSLDDAVGVFARDAGSGALTFVEEVTDGGAIDGLDGASGVAVSPDGRNVYVASDIDDAVAVLERDATSGRLIYVEDESDGEGGVNDLDGAGAVAVSPDGAHVYVASDIDDAVVVFSRNAGTGALTYVEAESDGNAGVDGLDGASAVAVSPDGAHVYVTGEFDDAVVVFERNSGNGRLAFVQTRFDGAAGVDGLNGASGVTVSPDGGQVYVAGSGDDAVAVFDRDAGSGALIFKEVHYDELGGLNAPRSVALSPGGYHLFAASSTSDSVAVFNRNPSTGSLSFLGAQYDDAGPVDGLSGAYSVVVSPDGKHVYTAALTDDAVAAFSTAEILIDPPVADFAFSPPSPVDGEEISFLDASTGGPTSWSWNFGDGTTSTLQNPFHTYTETGTYSITLTVSNAGGSDSTSTDVTVESATNCDSRPTAMCLNKRRFNVEVDWTDFSGNTGSGQVVPFGSDDSGLFWFFAEDNWEMLIKVLNGCSVTNHFWVFAAATTNVEYTLRVTDTETFDSKSYFNPLGNAAAAITDTEALATCDVGSAAGIETVGSFAEPTVGGQVVRRQMWTEIARKGTCATSTSNMCLNQGRFKVEVYWGDFQGDTGMGQVVPFGSDDSGLFWFFAEDNWEMLVKVLNGCGVTHHFWVFAAATTNVEYTLRVTDTKNGVVMEYFNPLGNAAAAITDTEAFATCP